MEFGRNHTTTHTSYLTHLKAACKISRRRLVPFFFAIASPWSIFTFFVGFLARVPNKGKFLLVAQQISWVTLPNYLNLGNEILK